MLIVILRCSCMSGPIGCSLSGAHLGPREPQPPEQHIQQHNKQSSRQVASLCRPCQHFFKDKTTLECIYQDSQFILWQIEEQWIKKWIGNLRTAERRNRRKAMIERRLISLGMMTVDVEGDD